MYQYSPITDDGSFYINTRPVPMNVDDAHTHLNAWLKETLAGGN